MVLTLSCLVSERVDHVPPQRESEEEGQVEILPAELMGPAAVNGRQRTARIVAVVFVDLPIAVQVRNFAHARLERVGIVAVGREQVFLAFLVVIERNVGFVLDESLVFIKPDAAQRLADNHSSCDVHPRITFPKTVPVPGNV